MAERTKKVFNNVGDIVDETLEGLVAAYGGRVHRIPETGAVVKSQLPPDRVGILIGGGSGHEPLFPGFIGENLADGSACGNIFAAPSPDTILAATKAVDRGKGVLYVYGNYSGDNMNFDIAAELATEEGIETRTVRVWDDVATEEVEERRGIAGDLFVIKVAGAAPAAGYDDLDAVFDITSRARDNTRSLGVGVSPGTFPETGKPTFELPEDEIEIGMGLHGEPGVSREKMTSADDLVDNMMDRLLGDFGLGSKDEVAVLVNDLGSTTVGELLIVNRRVQANLSKAGISVHDVQIGRFCTTQEMAGFSISLLKLDDELKRLYDMAASSMAFSKGGM
jgi:dihydroxyacetone kinase-like protein